jgi:hypothetical protein
MKNSHCCHLLELLLGANVVCVATLLLPAVCCPWMKSSITLTAYHLVTVILLGQDSKRWFNYTTTKTQNQVEGGFCKQVNVNTNILLHCQTVFSCTLALPCVFILLKAQLNALCSLATSWATLCIIYIKISV